MLHGYWLKTLGIDGAYERADLLPEQFPVFFRNLSSHGFVGGNITKPYKELVFHLVDAHDSDATAVGAVNTVWFENGRLIGGNTDASGFISHLDDTAPGWDRPSQPAVVLGAGGAARAVIHALLGRNRDVVLVNRTITRAQQLAVHFGPRVSARSLAELGNLLARSALLVNTSALGAIGQPSLDIDLTPLPSDAVVYDINYVPLETDLLKAARNRGLRTVDGLGMLLHQAVPAFAKWFGVVPRVTAELRSLLETDIRAQLRES
jgi:shikimate dehydrogenase